MGSVNLNGLKAAGPLLACTLLFGCSRSFHVKDNLSSGQITQTAIIRRPSPEKSLGLLPKYEDYLEGYILGQLVSVQGEALEGVPVKVLNEWGQPHPRFSPGATDHEGVYKIHFSLPIIWRTVDFQGKLALGEGWKAINPQSEFRIYFDNSNGLLVYAPKSVSMAVKSTVEVKPSAPAPVAAPAPAHKKKQDDFMSGFDFP